MSSLLITGGSGFIGSHFQQNIRDAEVINLDLVAPSIATAATYVPGDVRSPDDMAAALTQYPVQEIICLAAEHKDFGVPREDYFQTNEYGTKVICHAASRTGVRKIVYYSSVAVYGNVSDVTNEDTLPVPSTHYGESKLAGEGVVRAWAADDSSRRAVIFRPTVVFGERNVANLLRLIIQIDRGRYAHLGAADNIKSIAYVENLFNATRFAMRDLGPGVHTFNYVDEPQLSIRKIADVLAEGLGKKWLPTIPISAALSIGLLFDAAIGLTGRDLPVSSARIRKALTATHHDASKILSMGFEPKIQSDEGLRRMVAWYVREKTAGRTPVPGDLSGG